MIKMPYKEAKYTHHRRRKPEEIFSETYKTVPVTYTKARKKYPIGTLAIIGKSKKTKKTVIQSILIPK